MEVLGFAAYFFGVIKSLNYYSTWSILAGDFGMIKKSLAYTPSV